MDVGPSDWGTHLDFNWLLIGCRIALGEREKGPRENTYLYREMRRKIEKIRSLLDGRNRAIVIAESLARAIAAIRMASVRWPEISPHRPCVRCAAIRIARLALNRLTFVPHGTAGWLAGVDRVR